MTAFTSQSDYYQCNFGYMLLLIPGGSQFVCTGYTLALTAGYCRGAIG